MKRQQGFIAVTSVLVLGTLFLSLTLSATFRAVSDTQMDIARSHGYTAESLAYTCAEHALMYLTRELHYLGNEVLNIGDGQCEAMTITEEIDGTRTIHTVGTIDGHVHRVIVEVSDMNPGIVVSSYKSTIIF